MSTKETTTGRIDWPAGWERTPSAERTKNRNFQATLGQTTKELETELYRLDVDDWRVDFGNQHRKSNGMPRYNANPDDPGFVLRWSKDGEQFAVACDKYSRLRDNVRTAYLWVHETRMRGQRPVETGDTEFAAARLPGGDEDAVVATEPPHEILGVAPDATEEEIQAAFRERAKETHADQGGSSDEFMRVQQAREAMLDD